MDDTRTAKKEKIAHSANHIISSFILSKRSTKSIYSLNPARIGILRYLCDSMDIACKRTRVLRTRLYLSQISKHCHIDRKNLSKHLKELVAKKLLRFDRIKHSYSLGKVLLIWGESPHSQDMGRFAPSVRYGANRPISNSSNSSNNSASHKNIKNFDDYRPAKTAKKMSSLLKAFLDKKEKV